LSSSIGVNDEIAGRRRRLSSLSGRAALDPPRLIHSPAMDRRLARRNIRTALIASAIGLLMFALTFVAALLYVS
jgi:hypothetical protein